MSTEQHHKQWGVTDFERYHSGKMTESEMHALEKAALDDPFLEDALEGYAFTKTPVADISELKERLWPEQTTVEAPVIWYKRKAVSQLLKAAAMIIIVSGLGWLLLNKNQEETPGSDNNIVANQKQEGAASNDSVTSSLYNLNDSIPAIAKLDDEQSKAIIKQQQQQYNTTQEAPVADAPSYQYDTIYAPAEKEEMDRNDKRSAEKSGIKLSPSKPAASPAIEKALEDKITGNKDLAKQSSATRNNDFLHNHQQASNQVRGRVIDNTGKPVPYATVRNNTDNMQTVQADANGNFMLTDPSGNSAVKIEANATGYDQASTVLNNNSSGNTIVLNQSQNALSEVVVSGYGKKSRKENYQWTGKNSNIALKNAEPLEGWAYFYYVMNDSIVNNKILYQQKGRIVLKFETDAAGAVQNVVIKKSLNDSADNAALKLLYKAPVLRVKNNKMKGEATIKIGL